VVVHPAIKHVPRSVVHDAHERMVRCRGLVIVGSDTEDKFEDAMEVTASSPLFETALVLVRFDHVARLVVNAMISTRLRSRKRKKERESPRPRSV